MLIAPNFNIRYRKPDKNGSGFTLVEVLLYLAIAGSVLVVVSLFLSLIMQMRVRNEITAEVEQQGQFVMQRITQVLRNAQVVNSPAVGNSSTQLSVDSDGQTVVFDGGGTTLTESQNGAPAQDLTAANLKLSNLSFSNISNSGSPGLIRVQFTLSYNSSSNDSSYNYFADFYDSVALRK